MNEVSTSSVEQLTAEIIVLKNQTAINILEIGQRLLEAKEKLNHGEWMPWLESRVGFTIRTANRFMKAAKKFSNWTPVSNLEPTKVLMLLEMEEEEASEFISTHHSLPNGETKTVDEMTKRELEAAIKAKKEADKAKEEAEKKLHETQERLSQTQYRETSQRETIADLVAQVKQLKSQPTQVLEVEVVPKEITDKLARLEGLEKQLKQMKSGVHTTKQLEEQREQIEESISELQGLLEDMRSAQAVLDAVEEVVKAINQTGLVLATVSTDKLQKPHHEILRNWISVVDGFSCKLKDVLKAG